MRVYLKFQNLTPMQKLLLLFLFLALLTLLFLSPNDKAIKGQNKKQDTEGDKKHLVLSRTGLHVKSCEQAQNDLIFCLGNL